MDQDAQSSRKSIIACIAAVMSMSTTLGLSWPLLAIVLENRGVDPWLNGLSASSQMAAILVIMPVAPRLIARLGLSRAVGCGIVGMAASLALIPLFDDVWLWFPIRFAIGLFGELIFIAGDIWINRLATEQTRGRLIGVYSVFVHSGFAVGPLAIMWLGSDDWTVLWLGVGIIFLGLVPLVLAGGGDAEPEGEVRARLGHFLRTATTLMFAALMFGLIESSTESLLLVFALGRGLEEQAAAFLLALFILGSIVGPLPAGWLADRLDPLILMSGACLGILITLIALPLGIDEPALVWPTMIAMGTFVSSLYVVAMTMMGRRYRGSDLVGVNTSYVFVWGIGAAVGPGLSGGAMTMVGPNGMPAVGGLLCVLFLAVCGRQIRRELARRQGSAGREV